MSKRGRKPKRRRLDLRTDSGSQRLAVRLLRDAADQNVHADADQYAARVADSDVHPNAHEHADAHEHIAARNAYSDKAAGDADSNQGYRDGLPQYIR